MSRRITVDERWLRVAVVGVICLVILGVAIGWTVHLINTKPSAPTGVAVRKLDIVDVEAVTIATLDIELATQGEVIPRKRTTVTAEVAGKLTFVDPDFEAGETFQAGERFEDCELLLQIDRADYEAALAGAQANLADAELALTLEEVRKVQALRDWAKLGNGEEPSELVTRVPQLASANAKVAAARALVGKAEHDLQRTEIRVPYDCRVERTYVDEGAVVTPGMPLADLVSRGAVEVRLPLSLEDYGYLKRENGRVIGEVRASGRIGGREVGWTGRVLRSEELVERSTRSINVVVEFGADGAAAPPVGMFVRAWIEGVSVPMVARVPRTAVIDGDKILLVKDRKLEIRPVEILRTEADAVIVRSGLEAGEQVVITPPNAPRDGDEVVVRNEIPLDGAVERVVVDGEKEPVAEE